MLTQEQINEDWSVRSDNYNRYVEEEFTTERPAKWLERIEKYAPEGHPLKILDAGCGPGFFSVLLSDLWQVLVLKNFKSMGCFSSKGCIHFLTFPRRKLPVPIRHFKSKQRVIAIPGQTLDRLTGIQKLPFPELIHPPENHRALFTCM